MKYSLTRDTENTCSLTVNGERLFSGPDKDCHLVLYGLKKGNPNMVSESPGFAFNEKSAQSDTWAALAMQIARMTDQQQQSHITMRDVEGEYFRGSLNFSDSSCDILDPNHPFIAPSGVPDRNLG